VKSSTVRKRLLKQLSYHDRRTNSLRLWQYSKGRRAHGRATLESATRIDGFYANPDDAFAEAAVETRLANEIENPVNQFMARIGDAAFVLTDDQPLKLTRYVFMLFQRSRARRLAAHPLMDAKAAAFESFLSNEARVRVNCEEH